MDANRVWETECRKTTRIHGGVQLTCREEYKKWTRPDGVNGVILTITRDIGEVQSMKIVLVFDSRDHAPREPVVLTEMWAEEV